MTKANQPNKFRQQDNIWQSMVLLYRMRWVAVTMQLIVSLVAVEFYQFDLPLEWILVLIGFEFSLQVVMFFRFRRNEIFSQNELFVHLIIDSLFLAGLVFLTGGTNNPFTYLLLLSIALGTFMLRSGQLIAVALLVIGLYSILHLNHVPLATSHGHHKEMFSLHMAGMWINFGISALLLAFFGLAGRKVFLAQQSTIQQLREKQLKDEQVLSLGIMSAGAAHELGTPLSTMAIIAEDLKHQNSDDSQSLEDLELLQSQISRCKTIIENLSENSQASRDQIIQHDAQGTDNANLRLNLLNLIDNWKVIRPQIVLNLDLADDLHEYKTQLNISVTQAISNLLNNAAEASMSNENPTVALTATVNNQVLDLQIQDYGPGIPDDLKSQLGTQILDSNKPSGLGWGSFLSNASIERVGGKVSLQENELGTITRINIPLYLD